MGIRTSDEILIAVIFLIVDTFTDSLARLTGDEQKAAKTTAFGVQLNPANHSLTISRHRN